MMLTRRKSRSRWTALILVLIVALSLSSVAQAQDLVKDPFTDGNLLDPNWTVRGAVYDDPLDGGNLVLKAPLQADDRTHAGYIDSVMTSTYTPLELAVRFNLDQAGDQYAQLAWSLRTTTGGAEGYNRNSSGYGFKLSSDKKTFSINRYTKDGNGAGHVKEEQLATVTTPSPAILSGWNMARFVWGYDGALALSINGKEMLTAVDTANALSFAQLVYTGFVNNTAGSGGKYFLFDDIKVSAAKVKEPAFAHPRILIGPGDLPELRDRLANSAVGRRTMQSIRGWVNYAAFDTNAPLKQVYPALVNEDTATLSAYTDSFWKGNLSFVLSYRAFDCLVRDDAACGSELGAALATYAKISGGTLTVPGFSATTDFNIGYAYDFAYNYMTDTQRQIVRDAISKATLGTTLYGMNLVPQLRDNNVIGEGTQKALLALAIEGEPGYDPALIGQAAELMKDYLTYGVYPTGAPTEDMHYFNFGMNHGAATLTALAKRGNFLYDLPSYRATKNWYIHSMEPYGNKFSTLGDTPNDGGGLLANYVLMKWLNPDDAEVDFVWRNRVRDDYTGIRARQDFLFGALFGLDYTGGTNTEAAPVPDQWGVDNAANPPIVTIGSWNPAPLQLPNSFADFNRGLFITRSEWSKDSLAMTFETNSHLYNPAHTHSNSNDFTVSAFGQKWAFDRGFHIYESRNHSSVLIDGKGQGFFATKGKTVGALDSRLATTFIGDAKYAYDYRWTFKGRVNNDENKGYTWEYEPLSIRPQTDSNATYRALENPVANAFRSATLIRGEHPYVLVVDDIKKDQSEHVYDWLMQVPNELEEKSVSGSDLVLGLTNPLPDSPQMLVRSLQSAATADLTQRDTYVPIRLESFEVKNSAKTGSYASEKFGMGKRVVITSRSVSPDFKTLLFPYKPGAQMPTTTWTAPGTALKVEWTGQKDEYTFQKLADGRTAFGMVRNGGEAFVSVGLKTYNPLAAISVVAGGTGPNVALDANGVLTVTGKGWSTLDIAAPNIVRVVSDGSVGTVVTTENGVKLTEKSG